MTLLTPYPVQAIDGDPPIQFSAAAARALNDAAFASGGVAGDNDLVVSQHAAGPALSVDVAAGIAVFQGVATQNQGKAVAENTAVYTVPVDNPPSVGTARRDSIVAVWFDKQADGNTRPGDAAYGWDIICVAGTPVNNPAVAAAPTFPAALDAKLGAGGYSGYEELSQIARAAGELSILSAAIFDVRRFAGGSPVVDLYLGSSRFRPILKCVSISGTTDASGILTFDYSEHSMPDFPNAALGLTPTNGDHAAFPGGSFSTGINNTAGFSVIALNADGTAHPSANVRCNVIAFGY